jgi:hypothetical protein
VDTGGSGDAKEPRDPGGQGGTLGTLRSPGTLVDKGGLWEC